MTLDEAKATLIAVLHVIQARQGLPCPALDGSVVPPKVLEKFDSTVWPAATTMVARQLAVTIPPDVHIFGGDKGGKLLTIDEASQVIYKKSKPKIPVTVAA